jgi:hypothetical protein
VTPVESLTAVFHEQTGPHFLPPLTRRQFYRPDMSGGADRVFHVSRPLFYSFFCPQIQFSYDGLIDLFEFNPNETTGQIQLFKQVTFSVPRLPQFMNTAENPGFDNVVIILLMFSRAADTWCKG